MAVGVVAGLLLVAAGFVPVYSTETFTPNGQLIWTSDEAYLVVLKRQLGWKGSCLRLLGQMIVGLVGGPTPADDGNASLVVIRVTPTGLETHEVETRVAPMLTVFEGHLFADRELRWSGTRFEPATADEQRRYAEAHVQYPDYLNVDGWSNQRVLPGRSGVSRDYPLDLAGQHLVFLIRYDRGSGATVDLQRGSEPPRRLWSLDERAHRVTAAEYHNLFVKRG
jgi:hypothetical protein